MHIIIEIPSKINTNNNKVHITDNLQEALLLQGEGNMVIPVSCNLDFPFTFPYILGDFDFDMEYIYKIWHRLMGFPYYFISAGDLSLREIIPGDEAFLKKLFSFEDNLSCSTFVKDADEINSAFLDSYINNVYGIFDYGFYVLCLRENPIGLFGIGTLDNPYSSYRNYPDSNYLFLKNHNSPTNSIGYCLLPGFRGQGLGLSGVRLLLDYCRYMELDRLLAVVDKKNIPSLRLLQKLGFSI